MKSSVEDSWVPLLLRAQNEDGAWGHRLGSRSSAEPTAWALLALAGVLTSNELSRAMERGRTWLLRAQLADGSWPASPGQPRGSWTTSLACLALSAHACARAQVARGVRWLCDSWPGEGSFWWRLRHSLFADRGAVRQNFALRGWSWSPGTSSWVEPTSYALLLLRHLPEEVLPSRAANRRRLGEAMLYDRMCPGGGWNCGNPLVYGVLGTPQIGPTVWALLALQDHGDRQENQSSLEWLDRASENIEGPSSLALAHLCLETYGRPRPALEPTLWRLYRANAFLDSVLALAWAIVALNPARPWLQRCQEPIHA